MLGRHCGGLIPRWGSRPPSSAEMARKKHVPAEVTSEIDRAVVRKYLSERLRMLRAAKARAGSYAADDGAETAFYDGCETEVYLAFDELLDEEPPPSLARRR